MEFKVQVCEAFFLRKRSHVADSMALQGPYPEPTNFAFTGAQPSKNGFDSLSGKSRRVTVCGCVPLPLHPVALPPCLLNASYTSLNKTRLSSDLNLFSLPAISIKVWRNRQKWVVGQLRKGCWKCDQPWETKAATFDPCPCLLQLSF